MPYTPPPAFLKEITPRTADDHALFDRLLLADGNYFAGPDVERAARLYQEQHGRLPQGLTEESLKAMPAQVVSHELKPLLAESNEVATARKALDDAKRRDADRFERAFFGGL